MSRFVARLLASLVVVALIAAACGDDGGEEPVDDEELAADVEESSTTAPTTTAPIPETGDALVDLQITAVTFGDDGFVTIQNRAGEDADVNGVFFCQRPNYLDLGTVVDGGVIPAGGSVDIPASEVGGLSEAGGEAALYTSQDFGSADAIFAYVQWGGGGGRAEVATEAGIWPGPDATVTPDPAIGGIELFGDPVDPASWG